MTTEFSGGALFQRWKEEREEDRALWRDTQRQINLLSRKITDFEDQLLRQQEMREQHRKENQRLHEEAAERDRRLASGSKSS